MEKPPPGGVVSRGYRVAWVCAAFVALAVSEWLVWTRAETVSISPSAMGTNLVAGLAGLLIMQVLVVLAFGYLVRRWSVCAGDRRISWAGTELWVVLAITALGVVLRVAALQEVPDGLWFDTAENGNQALRILHDPNYRPVFIAEATQLPALFVYFDALSINWFGQEALAVRLPSAIFGAATVPAVWWLGRVLGGPVLGSAAGFALATSRWHIDFSRLAIASIVAPFALAIALASAVCALRATRPRQRIAFSVVCGLAVSLGLWSYPASVLMVPALAVGVAGWVLHGGRAQLRLRLRRAGELLGAALVACVISLSPLIGVAINDPATVLQRSQTVAVSGGNVAHEVFESAIQHVLMFTVRGDRNGRHNTPGRPEVGWFAPLFLAGVGAALWRRGSGISLAVPGTLFFLAGGILTLPFEAPQSHRAIMAVVPASLLIGLPIALFWSRQRTLGVLLTGLLAIAGTVESADYFHAQTQEPAVYLENSILETQAGRWLHTLDPQVPVLATDRFRSYPSVRYLAGDHPGIAQPGTAVSEFLPLDTAQPTAVIASFDEPSLFERARGLYTQAPIRTFGAPLDQGQPLLYTMFVSKRVQEQTLGFLAENPGGTQVPTASIDAASDARAWSATMRVLTSGDYAVTAGGGAVAIDGEVVVPPGQPAANVFLARGAHAIHVTRLDGGPTPQVRVTLSAPAPAQASNGVALPQRDPLFFALPTPGGLLFTWQIEGQPPQALLDSAPSRGFEGTFNNGRPWTGQWRGKLRIAQPGDYFFHVEAISSATLRIDDRQVVQSSGAGEASTTLATGWHTISVDYVDRDPYARLFVKWRPPGEPGFSAIPDEALQPALRLP